MIKHVIKYTILLTDLTGKLHSFSFLAIVKQLLDYKAKIIPQLLTSAIKKS